VIGAIVLAFVLLILFKSSWRVAEPNQALIISGVRHGAATSLGFKIVTGAGTFVMPAVQKVRTLDLKLREAALQTKCVTSQGVAIAVEGVVIYKVGDDPSSIANAARRFLDQPQGTMDRNIQNLFDGHLRSIIGGMTMEEVVTNRDKLTSETRQASGVDMEKLGLVIDSLQIQNIVDPSGYITAMAAPHVAAIQQAARIAQANANQSAVNAEQTALAANSQSERDTQIKQASYKADVDKAEAEAAQAGPLAQATAQQNVTIAATRTAELEADRKEKELQTTVRKPADAEAYAITVKANANRDAAIAQAQAAAEQVKLSATANANATTITGQAEASAIQVKGEAEGAAIKARLIAEADGIKARADALAQNQEAVIGITIAEAMPQIVKEAASAFGNIDNMAVFNGAEGVNNMMSSIVGAGMAFLPLIRGAFDNLGKAKNVTPPKINPFPNS
jgi:uncharacterized membrane protein YqiK